MQKRISILDCKSPVCSKLALNAPKVTDYLCEDCKTHFEGVKSYLDAIGLDFTVNHNIVRGLDYYSKTVFEFISGDIGAQSTVCGGGRYDGLVSQMGGQDISALGFAIGIERLMLLMEAQGCEFPEKKKNLIYISEVWEKALGLKQLSFAPNLERTDFLP